jgi:regulator of sigma E protease
MNIFVGILGLGLLVLVHEAGHFFTARAVGMSPRKFYVGFPPPLVRVTRNGIEYGIGAIPLGGYVKIPGMHRPAPSDLDVRGPYFGAAIVESPELRPAVERIKERLAEGDMAGARGRLQDLEHALAEARASSRARKAAQRGLRELKDGLGEDAYWRQRAWKRIAVIFAGPGTNFVFAILLFAVLLTLDTHRLGFVLRASGEQATRIVEQVNAGDPAAAMGMRAGDRIVAVNGRPVEADEISRRIRASEGDPITVTVERSGLRLVLGPIRPKKDEGYGPVAAVGRSLELTAIVTREIGRSLLRLVQGEGREEISSPVGIVEGSSQALDRGIQTYLWVLGLISLSLALLNLLPLLPLDGGHIAFSIVEGVRGRSVGREVYERVSAVGIALVLLLFFVGLSNDVNRLSD